MKKYILYIGWFIFMSMFLLSCSSKTGKIQAKSHGTSITPANTVNNSNGFESSNISELKDEIVREYSGISPKQWGEHVQGVKTSIGTNDKVIALTFDACGGRNGNGYDSRLIKYLEDNKIPATLFINSRWIDANKQAFLSLAKNPLFEIENHGYEHRPLSVSAKTVYGINGTGSVSGVFNEIMTDQIKIQRLTGRKPKYFRSGTDYYDEVAVKIASTLGEKVVGYSVLGDAGATFSKEQIIKSCSNARPGSIIIFHMNHPEKSTARGVMAVVPELRSKGFRFVKLEDYDKYLE